MMNRNSESEYWNGKAGEHWSRFHERYDELLGGYGRAAIARADPKPGERFVDIGCGAGATTLEVVRCVSAEGSALGVDLSRPMLRTARRRAREEGVTNVRFVQADAATYRFEPGSIDGVVSRFGIMFFDDPVQAFSHIGRALRPDGRLAIVCWQQGLANEWITVPGSALAQHLPLPQLGDPGGPGLFALADDSVVRSTFEQAGFAEIEIESLILPQRFGHDVDDALWFMMQTQIAASMLGGADPPQRAAAVQSVRDALEPYRREDGVYLDGAAWLVSAKRSDHGG
jgi:SAM-dependent methyltransferase